MIMYVILLMDIFRKVKIIRPNWFYVFKKVVRKRFNYIIAHTCLCLISFK